MGWKTCMEDRISGLPDEILCHILSFLYTKEAAKTSILSHRWKNVLASVSSFDFCVQSPNMVSDRCAGFVDRVLALGGSSYIHRLRLECANIEDYFSRIDAWICTAISRKVVELDLCLLSYSRQSSFELPRSLFMCDTLEVLRLRVKSNLITKPPTSNCFPSLKFMHVTLYRPFYDSTLYRTFYDSTRNLFSCCPVLEDLIIDGFVHHKPAFLFNVFAPKLKRLEINLYVILDRKCNHPNGWNLEDKFWKNAESLSKAKIALRVPATGYPGDVYLWQLLHYADQLSRLLAGINKVTYLSFAAPISEGPDVIHRYRLPKFHNLNHLKLHLQTCCAGKSLTKWLDVSPKLEHLVFKKNIQWCWKHAEGYLVAHKWRPPESVPVCLLSSLKTICIRGFCGRPYEMEVAKYLLKHGEVLTKVTIFYTNDLGVAEEMRVRQELSKFPRGSKTCQVELLELKS
ncbi:PREDICTED: F-box/LRR-repeat [Prunus dulcis]|uniref:PREDICTED: F-box/LRR-repeat n=1 Tax=Prunus dulcis TaxID=3755 RepID=A0A5E4ETJ0_PRUDU|nr:FBD-associated F-box protein At4g10400-like [Prunus dulcis]VVA18993.1 PREDICTED: F-box/LRR-repeat [Prunus dulcis]